MRFLFIAALVVFALHVGFVPVARAQEAQTERWVCLQADKSTSGQGNAAFRQRLTVKQSESLLPNTQTYIVVCVATANGQVCTTGNGQTDQVVYKKDNLAELREKIGFSFVGLFGSDGKTPAGNPVLSNGQGGMDPLEWESNSGHYPRKFLALNYWNPKAPSTGSQGGQQQSEIDFATAERKCELISWDPYGRVFDAETLEPVAGSRATLLIQKKDQFVPMGTLDLLSGNLINPQVTKADGQFSFVVPDGVYRLTTEPRAVSALAQVHQNYFRAYSDLYPIEKGQNIVQKGAIEHRDIPVVTQQTNRQPELMYYYYEVLPSGVLSLQGTVSHPLTRIAVFSRKISEQGGIKKEEPYRVLVETQADKWGRFSLMIDQEALEIAPGYIEVVGELRLSKVDLRDPVKQLPPITAIRLEPIPQYISSTLTDNSGTALPGVIIELVPLNSRQPYSSQTTDMQGKYTFSSEYVPKVPYIISYRFANGAVKQMTASEYLASEATSLGQNRRNIYMYKDYKNRTYTPQSGKNVQTAIKYDPSRPQVTPETEKKNDNQAIDPRIYSILGLLVALISVAAALFFGILRSRTKG